MWNLFRRTKQLAVDFCEGCGRVYGDACRRAAIRERALLQQAWRGMA